MNQLWMNEYAQFLPHFTVPCERCGATFIQAAAPDICTVVFHGTVSAFDRAMPRISSGQAAARGELPAFFVTPEFLHATDFVGWPGRGRLSMYHLAAVSSPAPVIGQGSLYEAAQSLDSYLRGVGRGWGPADRNWIGALLDTGTLPHAPTNADWHVLSLAAAEAGCAFYTRDTIGRHIGVLDTSTLALLAYD